MTEIGGSPTAKSQRPLLLLSTGTADFCSEGWQPRFPLERHAHHRPLNRNRRKCHRAGYVSRQVTSLASTVPKTGASLDIPFRGCESPGRGARSYAAKGAEGIGGRGCRVASDFRHVRGGDWGAGRANGRRT